MLKPIVGTVKALVEVEKILIITEVLGGKMKSSIVGTVVVGTVVIVPGAVVACTVVDPDVGTLIA